MNAHLISAPVLCLALSACTASLRPATVAVSPPDVEAEARGRQILARAADKHGMKAYRRTQTLSYRMQDHWQGLLAILGNPWPDAQVDLMMTFRTGSFDGRAELLSGEARGEVWGLQAWKSYKARPGEAAVFEADDDLRFILPAVQYLLEFPFRAQGAEIISYAGEAEVAGRTYELVFVTWGDYEAHTGADQYVAYVDKETGLIRKVQYTVREFARFAVGTIHYDDLRDVGGLVLPMTQTVTGAPDDDLEDYLHRMTLVPDSVRLNEVPRERLIVDVNLPTLGDEKPGSQPAAGPAA